MTQLTPQQERFVTEYLIDLNATAAYKRSGYKSTGNAAEVGASQLLRNPKVAAAVQQRQLVLREKLEITQARVLAEYAKLAFLDPRRLYDDKGRLIPIQELPADVAAAVVQMELTSERIGVDADGKPEFTDVRKIKFSDKRGALDSIARTLGMFTDKVEHSGAVTVEITRFGAPKEQA